MDLRAGDVIDDKYEVIRLLGRGGMGSVYEGRHRRIHRRVAIKVIHSVIASDRAVVERFEREAQAAGRIGSEHIVEVLDIGELPSGERFMVMEFLEGRSLGALLAQEGQLVSEHVFPLMVELLEGLSAAHEAGIIHRDLKPDNIWLARSSSGRGEFVKILDFGVSKFRTGDRAIEVTQTGVVIGTPNYMAPEQARADRDVDARADVYAVGIILYRCLAGQLPYEGATYNELMFKVVLDDPPPLDTLVPELDPEVVAIVHRALARERDDRYPSAKAFKAALVSWLQRNGFPVSLAVVDLLQSGDRVGAELLQSGEAWAAADAPRVRAPGSSQPAPASIDGLADHGALFDGNRPIRRSADFDGARTARQSPLAKRDRYVEHTDVIDAQALAAMSRADRHVAPRPIAPLPDPDDEIATLERPAHRPPPEMTTRMTASLSTPAPAVPPRATGVTIAVGAAASALLVAVLVGIGVASSEAEPDASRRIGPDIRRLADVAERVAAEAREASEVERSAPPRDGENAPER